MTKTTKWDAVEYLETDEDIEAFLAEAANESPEYLIHCLGIAAKAKGMTEVAKQAGVTRASLYQSLDGSKKPKFETIVKVMNALNMKLTVEKKSSIA